MYIYPYKEGSWADCCRYTTSGRENVDPNGTTGYHRWELPVGNYHGNSGNYHYPFFRVIFRKILHDFICKNCHENQSDRYPFFLIMANYPSFLMNDHNINFQMYYQN